MGTRTEQAKAVLEAATADAPEYMRRTGWHQCSDVLDEKEALFAIEDQLGDQDYVVFATKTCAGFIVWNSLHDWAQENPAVMWPMKIGISTQCSGPVWPAPEVAKMLDI